MVGAPHSGVGAQQVRPTHRTALVSGLVWFNGVIQVQHRASKTRAQDVGLSKGGIGTQKYPDVTGYCHRRRPAGAAVRDSFSHRSATR